eukprot:UC4_evm1s403
MVFSTGKTRDLYDRNSVFIAYIYYYFAFCACFTDACSISVQVKPQKFINNATQADVYTILNCTNPSEQYYVYFCDSNCNSVAPTSPKSVLDECKSRGHCVGGGSQFGSSDNTAELSFNHDLSALDPGNISCFTQYTDSQSSQSTILSVVVEKDILDPIYPASFLALNSGTIINDAGKASVPITMAGTVSRDLYSPWICDSRCEGISTASGLSQCASNIPPYCVSGAPQNGDGSTKTVAVDTSPLWDGKIGAYVVVTDPAGNDIVVSSVGTKDTQAPVYLISSVNINSGNSINDAEKENVAVSLTATSEGDKYTMWICDTDCVSPETDADFKSCVDAKTCARGDASGSDHIIGDVTNPRSMMFNCRDLKDGTVTAYLKVEDAASNHRLTSKAIEKDVISPSYSTSYITANSGTTINSASKTNVPVDLTSTDVSDSYTIWICDDRCVGPGSASHLSSCVTSGSCVVDAAPRVGNGATLASSYDLSNLVDGTLTIYVEIQDRARNNLLINRAADKDVMVNYASENITVESVIYSNQAAVS